MPPELHEDFGEKIGGAKKDLWKDRGLYTDDLDEMNEREAEKYVKKDNVWKKPDYQSMLDEGIPLGVVFFMKKVRDSLNASPQYPYRDSTPEKRLDRQKQYVETVRELQAVVEGVRTVEDVMQVCDRFFLDNGYLEKRHGYGSTPAYQGTKKGSDNPVITNKLFRALRVHSPAEFERDYTRQAQKEQFGVAKDQKVPRGYELHLYDGKGYSRNRDWKEGTYDDYVRGWVGTSKEYPKGVIHFAPNVDERNITLFDRAFDTLEMFRENGAAAETVVRAFGKHWEQPLFSILNSMPEPEHKPSVKEQLKQKPEQNARPKQTSKSKKKEAEL